MLEARCNHPSHFLDTARNMLLLYRIATSSSPGGTLVVDYLWDAWYNLGFSEPTRLRFILDVTKLIHHHQQRPIEAVWQSCLDALSADLSDPQVISYFNFSFSKMLNFYSPPPRYWTCRGPALGYQLMACSWHGSARWRTWSWTTGSWASL